MISPLDRVAFLNPLRSRLPHSGIRECSSRNNSPADSFTGPKSSVANVVLTWDDDLGRRGRGVVRALGAVGRGDAGCAGEKPLSSPYIILKRWCGPSLGSSP